MARRAFAHETRRSLLYFGLPVLSGILIGWALFQDAFVIRGWMIASLAAGALSAFVLLLRSNRSTRGPGLLLHAGVFCTFAAIGPMLMMAAQDTPNFVAGLVAAAISGLIAVRWEYSFSSRRFYLIPLVNVAQIVVPRPVFSSLAGFGLFQPFSESTREARIALLGIEAIACVTLGFILIFR